jgi:hypothetical protein
MLKMKSKTESSLVLLCGPLLFSFCNVRMDANIPLILVNSQASGSAVSGPTEHRKRVLWWDVSVNQGQLPLCSYTMQQTHMQAILINRCSPFHWQCGYPINNVMLYYSAVMLVASQSFASDFRLVQERCRYKFGPWSSKTDSVKYTSRTPLPRLPNIYLCTDIKPISELYGQMFTFQNTSALICWIPNKNEVSAPAMLAAAKSIFYFWAARMCAAQILN